MNKQPISKNINNIIINPTTIGQGTSVCNNLQRATSGNRLITTSLPSKIISGGYKPIHHYSHSDGSITLFLYSGGTISAFKQNNDDSSTPIEITTIDQEPYCGVNAGFSVYLMTDDGAFRIDYNDETNQWMPLGPMPKFPAVKISTTNITQFTAQTQSFSLSGNYSHWQGTLNKIDQQTLTNSLLQTYSYLKEEATTAGFFIQPILSRYHLIDIHGNILFSSSPTMISAPTGFQCTEKLTFTTDDFAKINSATLSAAGFQLDITLQPFENSPWADIIDAIVIEATPILDPIDAKSSAQCRLELNNNSEGIITSYMPGVSITMIKSTQRQESLILNAFLSFSSIASPLIHITCPYVKNIDSIILTPKYLPSKGITSSPYRFSAHTSMLCGTTVLWGDIIQLKPYAPNIEDIATSFNSNSGFWRAMVCIEFDNSEDVVVWSGEGENNCPSHISPLLSYPDNHASRISIAISCGEKILHQTFPLSPLANADYAIYLNPQLTPFTITNTSTSFIIPSQHYTKIPLTGVVAVSQITNPLYLTAFQKVSEGSIISITSAVRSSSSWDFARTHAYAFTTTGIFALSINATHSLISSHIMDNRKITNPQSVTFANNAVYAVASGDLISISGSKSATIINNTPILEIAWENFTHQLIGTTSESTLWRYNIKTGDMTTSDAPANALIYNTSEHSYLYNNDAIYIIGKENKSISIKWQHTLFISNPRQRLSLCSFHLTASHFDGTIALKAHSSTGNENSYPITSLRINGAINAPIPMRIIAPLRPYITIEINGNVSCDFELHSIQLMFQ